MSSKTESTKSNDDDLNCGLLLRDIEEISKALYLHKSPHDAFNSAYDLSRDMAFNSAYDHSRDVAFNSVYDHSRHVASSSAYEHSRDASAQNGKSELKSNFINRDSSPHKDKKSSIWNWKSIKALAHTRHHRFKCCFFLHVHAVDGLPPNFNNLKLCVTWKRKANILRTHPAQVHSGMAEFEETLLHQCTIYVGRTGPHGSAKYDPKLFLLHASVIGAPTLDIGSRWVDLTRLLPLTLEELAGDKSSSGKWTTSFKLTGMAKGAVLNVSFGFSIIDGSSDEPGFFAKVPDVAKEGGLGHLSECDISETNQSHDPGSGPMMSVGGSYPQSQSESLKLLDELFLKQGTELSQSVTLLYQKLDEKNMGVPMEFGLYSHLESPKPISDLSSECEYVSGQTKHEYDDAEFDVIEQGIEVSVKDQIKPANGSSSSQRFVSSVTEIIDVADIFMGDETSSIEHVEWNSELDIDNRAEYERAADYPEHKNNSMYITEPAYEELDSYFFDLLESKPSDSDSLLDRGTYNEHPMFMRSKSSSRAQSLRRSVSLDDFVLAESIEDDFLNMLSIDLDQVNIISGIDHDTPKDLLRPGGEDTLAWGSSLDANLMAEEDFRNFNPSGYGKVAFAVDIDLSSPIQAGGRNHRSLDQSSRDKRNVEMLENMETEALMHQWGLTEKAFQYSPHTASGGFGSPVFLPDEEPLQLPPIVEGKGPIVRTKDGGFLRSMNPLLFRNANNGARLIVQVSAPVVLPSAMGSMALEMLQCWACVGVEKMCLQANKLMPLEDVTGKTIQQVLAEAESGSDASNRWAVPRESDGGDSVIENKYQPYDRSSAAKYPCFNEIDSDYVSIEDLVPMALTNIEVLLVEGLKIQCSMPDQEPPSSIKVQLAGNSTTTRKASELSSNFSSERASGLPILDVDGLFKYSLSLEEWLRYDSGVTHTDEADHEYMSKLFAAHCAECVELGSEKLKSDNETSKLLNNSGSGFGDSFVMGLKVQLRDPLRNYEMVGSPMLALVQVNRVYLPHQPDLIKREDEGADCEHNRKNTCQPMFKVSEVHLAGLNVARHGNKPFWGSSRQHQSGSRWLLSSGMVRSKKNFVSNSNIVVRSSSGLVRKAQPEDVLWSISVPIEGEAVTWDERIALNVHVRNPDIIFPTESV